MHPPKQQQQTRVDQETAHENALERWKKHRQALHDASCYVPQNGSITYVPSMLGAIGHSQIENFFKLYPTPEHPISHPENRIISRSITVNEPQQDSVSVVEEIMINFDHSMPIECFLPNVPATKHTTLIPMVFVVQYFGGLIQSLRVYWDQIMLASGLQIPFDNMREALGSRMDSELLLKRATKPSSQDFQASLEEREGQLLAQRAASMQRSQASKRELPISKRSTINEIVFSPTDGASVNEAQLRDLNKTLDSMCITPMRERDENKILGIGPSKYLSSNLFRTEDEELEESIRPPNLSLATPVHQSKIGRFSVSRSRIFGDSECESEPQSPVTSKPPSLSINTAQRIWGDNDEEDAVDKKAATRHCSKNFQSKVFDQEGSPFLPSLKINFLKPGNSSESTEETAFVPALGGTQAHDSLRESPLLESESIGPLVARKELVSHISLGAEDEDRMQSLNGRPPVAPKSRHFCQTPFGTEE